MQYVKRFITVVSCCPILPDVLKSIVYPEKTSVDYSNGGQMAPNIMRQFWSVIETAHTKTLLQMDDASLVQWLVRQTKLQTSLDYSETAFLNDYIKSRLALIRDMATERLYN
jgi:hypothetical protein